MSPSSVTFKLIVALWVLGCLVACTSPCEKSQTLAKELLEQLSAPEGAKLLYMKEVENLALQGVGTGFGIKVLYGSNEEYSDIVSRYQELLTRQEWVDGFDGYSGYWTLAKSEWNMGRLLSRIEVKLFYRFQQEDIPCSRVLYTIPRNYARLSSR